MPRTGAGAVTDTAAAQNMALTGLAVVAVFGGAGILVLARRQAVAGRMK